MTVYILEAYNTDSRYPDDVRYREYTRCKERADLFNQIPRIQFSDSGHGICFSAREHKGTRKELRHELSQYVFEQMLKLYTPKIKKPTKISELRALNEELHEVLLSALGSLVALGIENETWGKGILDNINKALAHYEGKDK